MSADNWTLCPWCHAAAVSDAQERKKKADDAYGKVPPAEYARLQREADKPVNEEATLREDYEIGIWENEFSVSYRAGCTACSFTLEYKHAEAIPIAESRHR